MKFGERLLSSQHPPWSGNYINYLRLKQLLNPLFDLDASLEDGGGGGGGGSGPLRGGGQEDSSPLHYDISSNDISALHQDATSVTSSRSFQRELNSEIQKALLFLLKSMGELASDLSTLSEQQRFISINVQTLLDGKENTVLELQQQKQHVLKQQLQEIDSLRMEYLVRIGSKLLLLLEFVELNIEAIVKMCSISQDKLLQLHRQLFSTLSQYGQAGQGSEG